MDTVCFVLLALLRVSVCLEHIPITGNCSDDASTTGERLEVFGITKTKITCNVLKSEDCGPLPGVFGGNSIGRPRDFRVEPIAVNKTEGYVPVAVFKWKPSSSGVDAVHLKGFQLKIRKILGSAEYSETMCRIFDLSRTKFQGNDNNLEFSETFPRLGAGPDIQYQATICSLPREAHCQSLHFALPEVQER
ncbi:uncharacterized protein LOC124111387 [Haliotis rufescens]|uniref:uncharacterized protein LOC124111387 n=1 Tax=Haliotis rufescens TaxID=6454 RepID=UPI00201EFA0C|nr:uncharacterized protein LOC124111387 [Haliotis rufescens]